MLWNFFFIHILFFEHGGVYAYFTEYVKSIHLIVVRLTGQTVETLNASDWKVLGGHQWFFFAFHFIWPAWPMKQLLCIIWYYDKLGYVWMKKNSISNKNHANYPNWTSKFFSIFNFGKIRSNVFVRPVGWVYSGYSAQLAVLIVKYYFVRPVCI